MNERVVKNPNFKNNGEFHANLKARGAGAKDYPNTHTEVEYLGNGKFAASIGVGHRVFFDKADGKPKKHKLTDERPGKDYVLIQSAKCCVEVYPYYAKYYDVQHEEVRLHEERWVVQRLFAAPDTWRDVDAYNPVIAVEEYSEPAGDVVKVTVTYDTDYGILTVEYFQRDGNALKHNVTFRNTSGSTETFKVLQRWAGIVGDKCNGKDFPLVTDEPFLTFRKADEKLAIAENLRSMLFNPDGSEKTEKCLQRPIKIDSHAQGMKTDFIYGNWILAQDGSLEIDPDTATLDDPTEDGHIYFDDPTYTRTNSSTVIEIGSDSEIPPRVFRGYAEWSISSIPDSSTIIDTLFKYHGLANYVDCHIHEMLGARPSTSTDAEVHTEAGEGTVYADPVGFPVAATGQEVDLGASADSDLQSQLSADWFAIGFQADDEATETKSYIYTEEKTDAANPKPTLYVEYTPPPGWTGKISGVTNPAKVMGVDKTNIAKVKGVASA